MPVQTNQQGVQTMMPQGNQQQMMVPQTGLIGSERALQSGLQGSLGMLQQGGQALQGSNMSAIGMLGGAAKAYSGAPRAFAGSVGRGTEQGVGALDPFRSAGMNAQGMEMAMLGGGTPEQQAAAMQQLENSPGFQFAQQQGERAAGRNQAASGGLGGGNFQKELARFNQGLASQQFDTRMGQLGNISGRGLQAAQGIGNLRGQQAQLGTQVSMGNAAQQGRASEVGAQLGAQTSMANASARNQMALAGANIMSGQGSQLANLYGQGAQNVYGTGQMMSGGRTQAGRDIAGQIGGASSALAGLQNQQGSALADLYGGGANNIANIISGLADAGALDKNNMAQLLASIETGTAGQVATLPSAARLQRPVDYMGNTGGVMSALGGMANAWDQGQQQQQPQVTQAYQNFDAGGYA